MDMDGLLIQPCDPILRGSQSKRAKKSARKHARKLLTRPAYQARIGKIYRIWIGYFERHLEYPFLWENNPLEIEYFLLALETHAAYIPQGAFPAIEEAIQRLREIAKRSRENRERHLPHKKIIQLSTFQRAPQDS